MFPSPSSWRIVRGDKVQIMAGKDKGKQGQVMRVVRDQRFPRVFVSGLNIMTRRVPKRTLVTGQHAPGFSVKMEAPLHYSNVMLVDPLSQKPVRVYFKFEDQPPFKRVRLTKGKNATNSVIPWPEAWKADLTPPQPVGEKDTRLEVVNEVTYDPATDFTLELPSAHLQKKRVQEQRAAAAAERKAAQQELYKRYRPLLFSKAAAAGKPSDSSVGGSATDSRREVSTSGPSSVRSYCSSSEAASSTAGCSLGAAGSLLMLQRSRLSSSSSSGLLAWCTTRQQHHVHRLSWCGLAAAPLLI